MEHGFPPGTDLATVRTETVIVHVVMLLLVLTSIGGLFLTRRKPATNATICGWGLVVIAAPVGAMLVRATLNFHVKTTAAPFLIGYVLFVWLISLIGIIRSHISVKRQAESSPLGCVVLSLLMLGILITAMLPAVPTATEAARRSQCKSHLKQLAVSFLNYLDTHRTFPIAIDGSPAISWRVQLLPFFDQEKLFETYDQHSTWNSEQNQPIAEIQVSTLGCPSRHAPLTDKKGRYFSDYAMLTGPHTFSGDFQPRTPVGITDGASNTLAIVEAAGLNIVWTEPRDAQVGREPLGINFKGTGKNDSPGIMSSWHVGGAQASLADGSIRYLSQDIDQRVLKALTTPNGGEALPEQY